MEFKVSVKRRIIIGRKEYNSVEEMPPNVRQAYEKAMGSSSDAIRTAHLVASKTKFAFEGHEYESVEAMPQEVRQIYEEIMKAAGTGEVSSELIARAKVAGVLRMGHRGKGRPAVSDSPNPMEPQSFSSSGWMLAGLLLVVLLLGLYSVLYYGGPR